MPPLWARRTLRGLNLLECYSTPSECVNGSSPELVTVTEDYDDLAYWRSQLANLHFPMIP